MATPPLYTIGHSTLAVLDFIALLQREGVTRVIDVRAIPRSLRQPQFHEDRLPGALAAVERADDRRVLRSFADDTAKPYAARMKAYGKLGDRGNLYRCASKPPKFHRSTWKYGYDMDSGNYAAIRACTDEATLMSLFGAGPNHLVDSWAVRIASAEEDRRRFTPPKCGRVPEETRGGIPAEDLARCETVCRSLDSKEITSALSGMASRRDLLFVCAVEGMAFCRGRAARLLSSLPDAREELHYIALNEDNPYVVRRATDGLDKRRRA